VCGRGRSQGLCSREQARPEQHDVFEQELADKGRLGLPAPFVPGLRCGGQEAERGGEHPGAARLPSAQARGANGLAAIREQNRISATPMSRARRRSPYLAARLANGGLETINGRMLSVS
jgi:hypothetical protein